jgi:HAD superfamily hydrolase (TIGR01509 family)
VSGPSDVLQAVLWDMDGLLVDTEPLWTLAEHELAERCGSVFTPATKASIVGTRLDVAVPLLLAAFDVEPTPERVGQESGWLLRRMVGLFGAGELPLRPGVRALLASLAAAGVPQALVSSSYRILVDAVLAHGPGPFDVTVAGDEVAAGKPDPEPYLTAASALGVDPTSCVVLEDSPAGMAAGLSAGCAVLGVPSLPGLPLPPAARLAVRTSLAGVTAGDLAALLTGAPGCAGTNATP